MAIRAVGLEKQYKIGAIATQAKLGDGEAVGTYRTLRESFGEWMRIALHPGGPRIEKQSFTALRGVTFDIESGSVVGVVGRNGAGKTTLLKILARITAPTAGYAELHGRVGALLEVGTGFHPELTGRENILLSGAILGMRRSDITRLFDEIVAFAEVERFIDTPLKRYSSGMYLRLAFAVAAHLETEILLVDEVLAVGDNRFRLKSVGKMRDLGKGGRTVVYVSHDMSSVRQLCDKVIWLDHGCIKEFGPAREVSSHYEEVAYQIASGAVGLFVRRPEETASHAVWIDRVVVTNGEGKPQSGFRWGDLIRVAFHLGGTAPADGYAIAWTIFNELGERVAVASASEQEVYFDRSDRVIECVIGPVGFTAGFYKMSLEILIKGQVGWDRWDEAATFEIVKADPFGFGVNATTLDHGAVVVPHRWSRVVRS